MNKSPNVHEAVHQTIQRVRAETGRPPCEIPSDGPLAEAVELDSLDWAVVVVALEQELGVDPFRQATQNVQTLAQLVALYEQALADAQ